MKSRYILILALCVFISSILLAAINQGDWLRTAVASAFLFAALIILLLMAILFSQTGFACMGILAALSAGLAHYSSFLAPDTRMASAVVFTACLYIPLFAVLLADAPECPPFSPTGAFRLLLAISFLPVCLLTYAIISLSDPPGGIETVMLHGITPWLPIPLPGILACGAAVAYLQVHNLDHAERRLWFAASIAVCAVAMCFRSSLISEAIQPAMLVWPAAGAILILTGAALDAGWRHANVDELTQLPARRPMHNHMQSLRAPYVLAVIDADHFKSVNDRFGHTVGDQVLRFIAARLRRVNAPCAVAYRYGGEEFVVVLPDCDASAALPVLEDLRQSIASKPFILRAANRPPERPSGEVSATKATKDRAINITVSIGFAAGGPRHETPSDVLIAADKALYQAKQDGRNRVVGSR